MKRCALAVISRKMKSYLWIPVFVMVPVIGCKARPGKVTSSVHSQAARKTTALPSSQPKKVVDYKGCLADDRSDSSSEMSSDEIAGTADFLSDLQAAVREDRRAKVATFMHYPLRTWPEGTKRPKYVNSSHDFVANYDRLLPPATREILLKQRPECIGRMGDHGYELGDITMWFDLYGPGEYNIFALYTH
ncbi:hypothetical protein [Granulicella mallensis]|uniref:Uncharacterized protein n=1 Tax=Granulicella mallensis TaxID=940614 RepID=A0A7W7ZR13_9BACT|nr:hypothetical protein [Granulicella mallensis]MBB5064545.1 hypothetical protein [Granulicella mallensis]